MKQKLKSVINKGKIFALASIAALAINCQPLLNQPVKYDAESKVERLVEQSDGFYGYITLSDGLSTGGTSPSSAGYSIGDDFEPEAISSYTDNNTCDGAGFRKYWGTHEGEYWEDWAIDNTCQ